MEEPIVMSKMVLHTIMVTSMCAKLIDNNGSIKISFINLYFLTITIIIESARAISKLSNISLLERYTLLPTKDNTDVGG